jgi:hypothetical protein
MRTSVTIRLLLRHSIRHIGDSKRIRSTHEKRNLKTLLSLKKEMEMKRALITKKDYADLPIAYFLKF